MPYTFPETTLRWAVRGVSDNQQIVNTGFLKFTAASPQLATPVEISTAVMTRWIATMLLDQVNIYEMFDCTVGEIIDAVRSTPIPGTSRWNYKLVFGMQGVNFPPIGTTGFQVGDSLPNFAAATIRRLTTAGGRHYRSGTRLSPLLESDSVPGGQKLTLGAVATIRGHANSMFVPDYTFLGGDVVQNVGFSTMLLAESPLPKPPPGFFTSPVALTDVSEYLGSQVSRKAHVVMG